MFLPLMGILIFTILPLLFMIPMAFTNYSVKGDHLVLFDWTGFSAFKQVLGLGGTDWKDILESFRMDHCAGLYLLHSSVTSLD